MDKSGLKESRRDFKKGSLRECDLPNSPFQLLEAWLQDALELGVPDHNAMTLSTVDAQGFPTTRVVLLRDANFKGYSFFTNYDSAKGVELVVNPRACLHFFWPALERQVRIRGTVEKLTDEESDAYFASRPRDSQIGAWASPQSEEVSSREFLDQNYVRYFDKFEHVDLIPRPPHWGGFRLQPNLFEFWQGRPSRMHDRFKATMRGETWCWIRLAP
jgi:pyridoxamine 5'-phosphate oxidase